MSCVVQSRRAFLLGASACALPLPAEASVRASSRLILSLTNSVRRSHGLGTLSKSPRLDSAAQDYAGTLAKYQHLSHTVDGTRLSERVRAKGYRYARVAENIGWIQRRGDEEAMAYWFVEGWMNSTGHRRNILDPQLRHIGVGVTRVGPRYWGVQVFGTTG